MHSTGYVSSSLSLALSLMQAVLAIFRGLKRYGGGGASYRLSQYEIKKSILLFFDQGGLWPKGLRSSIPACDEWAMKTAKGVVKLVACHGWWKFHM